VSLAVSTKAAKSLTGQERPWGDDEVIVSKTDLRGVLTYANDVFQRVALMDEGELIGKPHNIIRHPLMPRGLFKFMWETIQQKHEIFAYVNNRAKNGDHYWVLAHITPNIDLAGKHTGYTSFRRKPQKSQIETIDALYRKMVETEHSFADPKEGLAASHALLMNELKARGQSYAAFIFSF